jgi:hypothetical protein
MTPETPPEETPEPEQKSPPAEPDDSPFEPFETKGFEGSDDSPRKRLDLAHEHPKRSRRERER